MNGRMPELTDVAIERMLAERARSEAPPDLVSGIVGSIASTPQRRRLPFVSAGQRLPLDSRLVLLAAMLALLLLAGVALLVGALRTEPRPLVVVPEPSSRPVVELDPTAQAAVTAPGRPDASASLVGLQVVDGTMDVFMLDPLSGQRADLGALQLPLTPVGQSVQWSSDRSTAIVYGDTDSLIAVADIASETLEPLYNIGPSLSHDVVSPAGDLVARVDDASTGVVIVDLDGVEVERHAMPGGAQPVLDGIGWSPDGSTLAVADSRGGLYLVPVGDGDVQELVALPAGPVSAPVWSPDGSRIAISTASCPAEPCDGGIVIVDVTAGVATTVTTSGDVEPAWSPDGERIVFRRLGGDPGIYATTADGNEVVALSAGPDDIDDQQPAWSPDGEWIMFRRGQDEQRLGDLWMVSSAGNDATSAGGEARLVLENAVADW